ncbi:MAG: hypothetical protein K2X11_07675 [Acetobacteraceae bacterium]|nr:hypothetical protein [Acetobacteraceae bacterium]
MIDVWSLPGPANLVACVVAELIDGRQCVLAGDKPPGFRRAVEDSLSARQVRLRVLYDDAELEPTALLRREIGLQHLDAQRPHGVWWVDGVTRDRAEAWGMAVRTVGEEMRHDPPHKRALLAVPLPAGVAELAGLGVAWLRAEPLGRLDLEVAARYAAASAENRGIRQRLRLELAVNMASAVLPSPDALRALEHWMSAPDAALCDPAAFAAHAREIDVEPVLAEFDLWRVHHAVLLAEIERERLEIVRSNLGRWRIPYDLPEADGQPSKRVRAAEFLELKHLCKQLRQAGEPLHSPLLNRLEALRGMRNALSHLEHASWSDISALETRAR